MSESWKETWAKSLTQEQRHNLRSWGVDVPEPVPTATWPRAVKGSGGVAQPRESPRSYEEAAGASPVSPVQPINVFTKTVTRGTSHPFERGA